MKAQLAEWQIETFADALDFLEAAGYEIDKQRFDEGDYYELSKGDHMSAGWSADDIYWQAIAKQLCVQQQEELT